MDWETHNWLLCSILGLMDPVFPEAGAVPLGSHLDIELAWEMLEFESLSEAKATIEKMGFVYTKAKTWCHPEELAALNTRFDELLTNSGAV